MNIRPIRRDDHADWLPLWDGYNAFYGRSGPTALDPAITAATWERFFNPVEPMFALVAELDGRVVGLVHYLYHLSTTRIGPICYLQDLFTAPELRGRGAGRALIAAVGEQAKLAGVTRLYWHTRESNATARALYDKVAQNIGGIVYFQDPL